MNKRPHSTIDLSSAQSCRKRARTQHPACRIALLSDELYLRIFSLLPPEDLVRCLRVSHRFNRIAGDSQVWKSAFYSRFVRPRLLRARNVATAMDGWGKWVEGEGRGETHWKRMFKLKHNWSRGYCDRREIELQDGRAGGACGLHVVMQSGVFITADRLNGLRAWKDSKACLCAHLNINQTVFEGGRSRSPSSIAVDTNNPATLHVVVGFDTGDILVAALEPGCSTFEVRRKIEKFSGSEPSPIVAVAVSWPFIAAISGDRAFTIYELLADGSTATLSSLKSNTVDSPLSLSLRPAGPSRTVASVAYVYEGFPHGWCIGIQELFVQHRTRSMEPGIHSRTATSSIICYSPRRGSTLSQSLKRGRGDRADSFMPRPTSISYFHPYMLLTHDDNTLTMLLVKSTDASVNIGPAQRLWGHSSAVSGVKIGHRGRAVSVSKRANELRIWELEGLQSWGSKASQSIPIQPESIDKADGSGPSTNVPRFGEPSKHEFLDQIASGWVGFDAEKVAVLTETAVLKKALVIYDFS